MLVNEKKQPYPLFSVVGVEIEYMITAKESLNLVPYTDQLFEKIQGHITNEIELGEVALNNELALHVVELKTQAPKKSLSGLDKSFHEVILQLNKILDAQGLTLMPSAMHPWDDVQDIQLWPHGNKAIYNTYHRIFNCRGHGWSNLQSAHLNLPFGNEEEFVRLHNTIRLLLPLIPALAASSPIYEGKRGANLCNRLKFYENNQKIVPHITGHVIPEFIKSFEEYHQKILSPMYQSIARFEDSEILQEEWLNSRGAIARFERDAIEIRVIDSQESPMADFSVLSAISGVLKYLIMHTEASHQALPEEALKEILDSCVKEGSKASLFSKAYLSCFNLKASSMTAKDIWDSLIDKSASFIVNDYQKALAFILAHGNLAERIDHSLPKGFNHALLHHTYQRLCNCLQTNTLFQPGIQK